MRTFNVGQDLDDANMAEIKELFDELARSSEDVCLDLSEVKFMDRAGLDGMMALCLALRRGSRKFAIAHVQGQPLRLLREILLVRAAAPRLSRSLC